MSSNCLVFHTSGGISSSSAVFLFLVFLRNDSSSSWLNSPSLMSNCSLIILVIGSCVTFVGFLADFEMLFPQFYSFLLVCSFQFCFGCALLLNWFIVCQAILDCLSSTESLVLSIWFCMYSVSSFRYMLANWFCAFLWRHRILRHCSTSITRGHASPIPLYHLSSQRAYNIEW